MRPPVFWAEPAVLRADQIVLAGTEGHHAATVRRLAAGERADVTDGAGTVAECVVTEVRPGRLVLAVTSRRRQPRPRQTVTVAQAVPKAGRGELAVELLTEVGVDTVLPWQAERCVARWRGDRVGRAVGHWRETAREAAKQSRRSWFPEVAEPVTTTQLVSRAEAADLAILLDPDACLPLAGVQQPADGEILIIVGPEGGISPAEAAALSAAGAVPARLGQTVLRTSSAGAVAAAVLSGCGVRWR
jgi:16S rRNA (uracil1498-N3)-methyltransferase